MGPAFSSSQKSRVFIALSAHFQPCPCIFACLTGDFPGENLREMRQKKGACIGLWVHLCFWHAQEFPLQVRPETRAKVSCFLARKRLCCTRLEWQACWNIAFLSRCFLLCQEIYLWDICTKTELILFSLFTWISFLQYCYSSNNFSSFHHFYFS